MDDKTSGGAATEELPAPNSAVQPGASAPGDDGGITDEDVMGLGEAFGVRVQIKPKDQPPPKVEPVIPEPKAAHEVKEPEKKAGDVEEVDPVQLDGLPEETKARIQKRMDKLTAKRREAEERETAASQRAQQAETERDQLTAKLDGAEPRVERVPADVHPILLAESEQDVEAFDRKLGQYEKLLLGKWDGAEAEKEGEPSFTAEQVRQRYAEIREMRESLIPQARKNVATRQQVNGTLVAKHYPDLMKPGSEAKKKAEALLDAVPGLKAHPYALMFIGAYLEGEKALSERMKAEKNPPAPPPVVVPPPPPPTAGSAPRRGPSDPPKAKAAATSVRNFVSAGATQDALAESIAGLETPDE